ncbi:LytR/AlgR family response regulator transcription factor [Caloranaerobacter azorensis]|uniref:Response regulator transcription factor n=1 Tax=Caloranaerobacter azorensis TaxID=116090 RepID=A0A6P1YEL6_9FIRM|nr:LytTR family DNA-binding domain-containing protein [Caloranaerobacter azorensis]QIB27671.1 response regulator transcription factor [Caloranaerobacter azorensis]
MSIRVIIADDDENVRHILRLYLRQIKGVELIAEAADGKELLNFIFKMKPDVVLTDIKMPNMSGLDVAKIIREADETLSLIFITSYNEYMSEAFNVYATDYIQKPIQKKRLFKTLEYIKNMKSKVQLIDFSTTSGQILINSNDILFIESVKRQRIIHTFTQKYCTYESLNSIEDRLNKEYFIRTHRSFIVNIKKVEEVVLYCRSSRKILFRNYEECALLSKRYEQDFRNKIMITATYNLKLTI